MYTHTVHKQRQYAKLEQVDDLRKAKEYIIKQTMINTYAIIVLSNHNVVMATTEMQRHSSLMETLIYVYSNKKYNFDTKQF